MTSDLHHWDHLAAAYALDALDDDQRRVFEALYPRCVFCRAEVSQFRATATALAEAVAAPAPTDLKARVMGQVARTRQVSPLLADRRPPRWRSFRPLAAAALAVVAAGSLSAMRALRSDPLDEIVAAPNAATVDLEGGAGMLRVVWSADRDQVALIGDGLEDPGDGEEFQLWLLSENGTTIPEGVFTPEDGRLRTVLTVADQDPAGWGVTIEPEGGSEIPTTPLLYQGESE